MSKRGGRKSGGRIKECRVEAGLSADELGNRIGKNRATIYRYETDAVDISKSIIEKIAEVCGINPAYISGWSDEKYIKPSKGVIAMDFIRLTTFYDAEIWVHVRYIIEIEQAEPGTLVHMRGLRGEGFIRVRESADAIVQLIRKTENG